MKKPSYGWFFHASVYTGQVDGSNSVKRILFLMGIILVAITSHCAYYNTFYNARKHYSSAFRMLERAKRLPTYRPENIPPNVLQEYQLCLEKCSRVLELYPESKWVDDAMLLMGKAFYQRGEYIQAHTFFKDLTTAFDFSDLVPEANYWWGLTLIELRRYPEAEEQFDLAVRNSEDEEIRNAAILGRAEILKADLKIEEAVEAYQNVADNAEDKNTRITAQLEVGDLLLELERDVEAEQAFSRAKDMGPKRDYEFQARFGMAIAIKNQERFEESIPIFEKLLSSGSSMHRYADIRYEIADSYYRQDKLDEAVEAFEEIATIYPNTDGSARGLFRVGEIMFHEERDWRKAHEFYSKVRSASNRLEEMGEISEQRRLQLQRLIVILTRMEKARDAESAGDSTGEKADTLRAQFERRREAFAARFEDLEPDTTLSAKQINEQNQVKIRLSARALDHYMAAEVFNYDLGVPDTAILHLDEILDLYFDTDFADKALFLKGHIYSTTLDDAEQTDAAYQRLLEEYPDSEYAHHVRELQGLEQVIQDEDSLYHVAAEADRLLLNPHRQLEAVKIYKTILRDYPESELAPRVHHVLGEYYEKYVHDSDGAYEHYMAVLENYPRYPLIASLRARTMAYKKVLDVREKERKAELERLEKIAQARADSIAAAVTADSLAALAVSDSLGMTPADSLAALAVSDSLSLTPADSGATITGQPIAAATPAEATPAEPAPAEAAPAEAAPAEAASAEAAPAGTTPAEDVPVSPADNPARNRAEPIALPEATTAGSDSLFVTPQKPLPTPTRRL
jgi:tetratricopeptide (TPR) repeat protein